MFPIWTMILAGFNLSPSAHTLSPQRWFFAALAFSSLFGLIYLLNQMRDREGDLLNDKLPLVARDIISRRGQRLFAVLLGLITPTALLLGDFGELGLWLASGFILTGILYNFTPVALERTPLGGVIAGFIAGWLLLRIGEQLAGEFAAFAVEVPYLLAFTAGCILTMIPDMKGDSSTGKNTLAVVFGTRTTMLTAALLIGAAGIWAGLLGQWALVAASLGGGMLVVWGWLIASPGYAVIGNKVAMFLLAIGVGVSFPAFLAVIVLYYPLARWYHRARFSLDYPSFRAD